MTLDELKKLDIKELKAMAYDQIRVVENAQKNLQIINQIIGENSNKIPKKILPEDVPQG